jgi:hypothetical protein
MLKVQRIKIMAVERAIVDAVTSATTMRDDQISHPEIPPEALTAAAMLAIQAVTMALYGPNDVACPSDVQHLNKDLT